MDVISLLNSSTEAGEEQERREKSYTPPSRSRTPWDANGYSMPINKATSPSYTVNTITASSELIHCDDSQFDSRDGNQPSSNHKSFSSRSSLSSTTSLQSTTHSRFSSMSTASSSHPGQSIFTANSLSWASESLPRVLDLTSLDLTSDPSGALSPTTSLGALALVAEHHRAVDRTGSTDRNPSIPNSATSTDSTPITPLQEGLSQTRARSPSDAILIKRRVPDFPSDSRGNILSTEYEQSNIKDFIRLHKRCVSAPDISATMDFPIMDPEPTPPLSQPPGSSSSAASPIYQAPDTPPSVAAEGDADAVVCMYIRNCDTGSQPRKAISHIFGRNKMCTRLIPSHVWVHYCRKHYQRSRYRNPKEYAKLQCDLVQQQIRRVHEWSVENAKNGKPGVVQNWGLAIRKREKKRLDDLGGTNRKRRADILNQIDDDEAENANNLPGTPGSPIPATAVPTWLLSLCGKGYTTQAILDIFNRLHTEILNDRMPCFPDIEILPNIATEQDEAVPASSKRRGRTTPHRRSQSLGGAMKPGGDSYNRRLSESSAGGDEMPTDPFHAQKRRRSDEQDTSELESFLPRAPRLELPIESGRRIQHLVHRPVFGNITENQDAEDNDTRAQPDSYARPSTYISPFGPPDQQSNSRSMGAPQTHGLARHGSRLHGRSQSDVTAFSQGYAAPQPTTPSRYLGDDSAGPSQQQIHGQTGSYTSPLQNSAPPMRMQQLPAPGHARHQSTPATYQSSPEPYAHAPGSYPTTPYTQPNTTTTLHPTRHIYETQGTRDLYSSRR